VNGSKSQTAQLEACGPVIGLLKDVQYDERREILSPGDLLIGFTDGISEAMTVEDEEWGEERMQAAAEAARDNSAREIIDALFAAADAFAAGAPQHDDMTLLVFRLIGDSKETRSRAAPRLTK
jgi:sigma-B regulation protein RsbU (phosphoserine phosphatase)